MLPPPTRRGDLVVGACVLVVTLSLVRVAVDAQMLRHVGSLSPHRSISDAEVPVIEHLRVGTKEAVWLSRLLVGAAVVAWMKVARRIAQSYD